jgi:rRNA-processing protein Efg1
MSTWREKTAKAASQSVVPPPELHNRLSGGISKKNSRRGGNNQKKEEVPAATKRKGTSSVRSKIRGLQRTLKHQGGSMTAAAKAAKEEEITSLTALCEDRKRRERERELAKKYHMVKFFERRKLQRRIEKVGELAKKPGADEEDLAKRRKGLEEDLQYVLNFPKDRPYVALFPSDGHTEESLAEVENIRNLIRETARIGKPSGESAARELVAGATLAAFGEDGDDDARPDEEDDFFL